MATKRANTRLQVGSSAWILEERSSATKIAETEAEEFMFSARNEMDWLNEHMAEIFSENQVNVAEIFKTPGKLRGKTPRTGRKANLLDARAPLSDVFSSTPRGGPSPFKQLHFEKPVTSFQVAEDIPTQLAEASSSHIFASQETLKPKASTNASNFLDSGYYGSQATESTQATQPNDPFIEPTQQNLSPKRSFHGQNTLREIEEDQELEERRSTEGSFQSAKEEQTRLVAEPVAVESESPAHGLESTTQPVLESPLQNRVQSSVSPQKRSPERLPEFSPPKLQPEIEADIEEEEPMEDVQSPQSDGSSPIRPIVRKSSLNFASLPAREPLTSKKSIGNRVSRTSHLEQSRTSYYGRNTGGKSMGNIYQDEDANEMDVDDLDHENPLRDDAARLHNKTSTQRLQDQINMLGKSQNTRPSSKSITANGLLTASQLIQPAQSLPEDIQNQKSPARSPLRKECPPPGAFPDDEEDSWIGPPTAAAATAAGVPRSIFSPRPQITKSHTTDSVEETSSKENIEAPYFSVPKRGEELRQMSPFREPIVPERTTSTFGHMKSASTSVLRSPKKAGESMENKPVSVSNPTPYVVADISTTPPKSPSRSRGSPLKAAKDKFSSILKTSRGLFASSAAVSADAKATLSPPASRMGMNHAPSMASLLEQPLYPDLTLAKTQSHSSIISEGPTRSVRKTRASTERAERKKIEEAKEEKEAQKMNDQLDKARQKVKDEARLFHMEQERVAAMQKEIASRKENERIEKESQVDLAQAMRSSPRKTKAQLEAEGIAAAALPTEDADMSDAPQTMLPPALPLAKSQIGRPVAKRPIRPGKDAVGRTKPPTVIRVDTGSQRGHQYHPSNSALAASLQDSLSSSQASSSQSSQGTLRHKASTSSIQSKASTSSFKSGATKALEAAARKKEQDELIAQKKREAKAELERQRAAIKEEERRKDEQQRRQEAERQRDIQREREKVTAAADTKKAAARQAMEKRRLEMEKAKETRPPPPAIRPGDMLQEKALPPLPQTKAGRMNSIVPRSQEDMSRPVSTIHTSTKVPPKRPLQQDAEDYHSRPALQRTGPSYQQNEAHSKRRKTSETFEDNEDLTENHPKMTAPPIRQSTARPKEFATKSLFPSGYANASSAGSMQKNPLVSQHNINQTKPSHPLDMTQVSKAPIAFASGSNQANGQSYKTPARPANASGKSAAKSAKASPRFQNGETIILPEVLTDSEDEDEDEKAKFQAATWTESPMMREQLMRQEGMDAAMIFGGPKELDMEVVFNKCKEKFSKFRARTSSANWSGEDRLTTDEIRKDVEARDKIRRQGFWTYDQMI